MKTYQWKQTSFFSSSVNFYYRDRVVGNFRQDLWGKKAFCSLDTLTIEFNRKGFVKTSTAILNSDTKETLGSITTNLWMNEFYINLDKKYTCKSINFWKGTWGIFDGSRLILEIQGSILNKGEIVDLGNNTLLVIAAYYIRNLRMQMATAAA